VTLEPFYSVGVFSVKALIRNGICLSRLLGIHLNLRKVVVFLDNHFLILVRSMLDIICPFMV